MAESFMLLKLSSRQELFWEAKYMLVPTTALATLISGLEVYPAGRVGEPASLKLSRSLQSAGFKLGRLKTGTPPRLAKNSIDFSKLPVQTGDIPPLPFSFMNERPEIKVTNP